jgi:6-phosphogluconate dehydrogenase
MGSSIAQHAIEKGHEVIAFDVNAEAAKDLSGHNVRVVDSLRHLTEALDPPCLIVLYVPHGQPTDSTCEELRSLLQAGDVVADGGNSKWTDSMRHAAEFEAAGVHFIDVGTSGGVSGARHGACFMVGGDRQAFELIEPLLKDLAIDEQGVVFVGPAGAGHFVKLVHNGIEFGMVQAIAEGVELLRRCDFDLDLGALFDNWQHGSVIRSWLVELMANALKTSADFEPLSTFVEDTGEVKWLVDWGFQTDLPLPVITTAQTALLQYRDSESAQAKAVALLRNQYGGHPVHHKNEAPPAAA